MEELGTRVKNLGNVVKTYVKERKDVVRWLAGQVETSLRTGEPIVFEFEGIAIPPVTLSAELGEERRRKVKEARYKALKNFKLFKGFTERRMLK
ncbi:MAG: hypothetical protein D4S01_10610 [Dehalococcoidia bacterium]|nr:MAG: hypothetical protein D4S01_10610 [Dehalococcoidia bacterium]